MLWNSRLGYEHSGLDFWLSSISCHAPNAPVFVVATFADLITHSDLPQDQLKKSYPQIVSFERVASVTGFVRKFFSVAHFYLCLLFYRFYSFFQGIPEFRERLGKVALSQGYMNSKVQAVYLQLEMFILGYKHYLFFWFFF